MNNFASLLLKLVSRKFYLVFNPPDRKIDEIDISTFNEIIYVPFWNLPFFYNVMEKEYGVIPFGSHNNQFLLEFSDYSDIWNSIDSYVVFP